MTEPFFCYLPTGAWTPDKSVPLPLMAGANLTNYRIALYPQLGGNVRGCVEYETVDGKWRQLDHDDRRFMTVFTAFAMHVKALQAKLDGNGHEFDNPYQNPEDD